MTALDTTTGTTRETARHLELTRFDPDHAPHEIAQRVLNNSWAVVFLWRNQPGWPVQYVTENVIHLTGYTAREWLEGTVAYSDSIDPQDLERVAGEVREFSDDPSATEIAHAPYRIRTRSGAVKWVMDRTQIRRGPTGEVSHYEGVVYDITELQDARLDLEARNREVQRQELLLGRVLAAVSDGLVYVGPDYRIHWANAQYGALCGAAPETWRGQKCHDICPADICRTTDCPLKRILDGAEAASSEILITRADGTEVPVWQTGRAVRDGQGRFLGMVESLRDLGPLRKSEEDRRRAVEAQARAEGRAEMVAEMLHQVGNAITPLGIEIETVLQDGDEGAILAYLRQTHEALARYGDRGPGPEAAGPEFRDLAAYLGRLADALDKGRQDRTQRLGQALSLVSRISSMLMAHPAWPEGQRTEDGGREAED